MTNTNLNSNINLGKWIIGISLSILAIVIALGLYVISRPQQIGKEDIENITDRYDPVFKNILIKDAYAVLSDIRLSELQTHRSLLYKLKEIKLSLHLVGAFDDQNRGLSKIFDLIENLSEDESNLKVVDDFVRINTTTNSDLLMTPPESSFFLTYQGLCYLKKMRRASNQEEYKLFLSKAKEKFYLAKQTYSHISNLWNGIGVCMLEEAHYRGGLDLGQIESARNHFKAAFNLYRSPITLATQINNYTYSNLTVAFYNTFSILPNNEGGYKVSFNCDLDKIGEMANLIRNSIKDFESAHLYDPNSTAIILSKAEANCMLSLCQEAIKCNNIDSLKFDNYNPQLIEAMNLIRMAKDKGFYEWEYLFSRLWVSNTLFRSEAFSKELLLYL